MRFTDIPSTTALKFAAFRAGGRVNEAMLPLGRTPEIAAKQNKSEEDDFLEAARIKAHRVWQRSGENDGDNKEVSERGLEATAEDEVGGMVPNEIVTLIVVDEKDGGESGEGEVIAMAKWQIVDRNGINDETIEADEKHDDTPTGSANDAAVAPIMNDASTPTPALTSTSTAGWNRDLMQLYSDTTDAAQDDVMKDTPTYFSAYPQLTTQLPQNYRTPY